VRPTLEVLARHLAVSLSNARLVHKLETMATTDGLTGLLNKRAMQEGAVQRIEAATRFGRKLSVLITDIDFFKRVNDTYGHDIGDIVIRGLGDILTRQKRGTDIVARFGGEEFVVLLPGVAVDEAQVTLTRLQRTLSASLFMHDGREVFVTFSAGVTRFRPGEALESALERADEALYEAKRTGKNRTCIG
jgi:diguanylate cyclase (GGDEF)-like protein